MMNDNQAQVFPVYRLVAEFADGSRLTFDGFTYEQARDAMEQAQDEHGDIGWYDGVTNEYYDNGVFYAAAVPPLPDIPFPGTELEGFEQETLFLDPPSTYRLRIHPNPKAL